MSEPAILLYQASVSLMMSMSGLWHLHSIISCRGIFRSELSFGWGKENGIPQLKHFHVSVLTVRAFCLPLLKFAIGNIFSFSEGGGMGGGGDGWWVVGGLNRILLPCVHPYWS